MTAREYREERIRRERLTDEDVLSEIDEDDLDLYHAYRGDGLTVQQALRRIHRENARFSLAVGDQDE